MKCYLDKLEKRPTGFTLIELLIVVAIIALLAAIAVPNFIEAQVRAKVSRVKADLRTDGVALEAYRVDQNAYPPSWYDNIMPEFPECLSTPIAYIQGYGTVFDIFCPGTQWSFEWRIYRYKYFQYEVETRRDDELYAFKDAPRLDSTIIYSSGPNLERGHDDQDWIAWSEYYGPYGNSRGYIVPPPETPPATVILYDPSNGTTSWGAIVRYNPS
jgi:prepilin-type N-terminal cleavage/methylation domain-containing protein